VSSDFRNDDEYELAEMLIVAVPLSAPSAQRGATSHLGFS
jgi:hypothetical protein